MSFEEENLLSHRHRAAIVSRTRTILALAAGVCANLVILGMVFRSIGRAIESRNRAEDSRQLSEAAARKMAVVAARTHNAVLILDSDGRIEWTNDGFTRITGHEADAVLGQSIRTIFEGLDTDQATFAEVLKQVRAGMPCRVEFVTNDRAGQRIWVDFRSAAGG